MRVKFLDTAHGLIVFVDRDIVGFVGGESQFYQFSDVFGRDFIEGAEDRDGGIIFDFSLDRLEKELVEFVLGESLDGGLFEISHPAVDGSCVNAVMVAVVILLVEPSEEAGIEVIEGGDFVRVEEREESLPD